MGAALKYSVHFAKHLSVTYPELTGSDPFLELGLLEGVKPPFPIVLQLSVNEAHGHFPSCSSQRSTRTEKRTSERVSMVSVHAASQ